MKIKIFLILLLIFTTFTMLNPLAVKITCSLHFFSWNITKNDFIYFQYFFSLPWLSPQNLCWTMAVCMTCSSVIKFFTLTKNSSALLKFLVKIFSDKIVKYFLVCAFNFFRSIESRENSFLVWMCSISHLSRISSRFNLFLILFSTNW